MKKRDLLRTLTKMANAKAQTLILLKTSGNHEKWSCAGKNVMIPRHREIAEGTAKAIIKQLQTILDALETEEEK